MADETIYEDNNIRVVLSLKNQSSSFVICFFPRLGSESLESNFESASFGYKFFDKYDISAAFVVPKWNHWWQPAEIKKAMEKIKECIPSYCSNIWTYGASMGGTGALMFANYFKSSGVISISPQASIDNIKADFDHRWKDDRKKIATSNDDWLHQEIRSSCWILYDKNFKIDKLHVDLIKSCNSNIKEIDIAFGEHATMRMLAECNLLSWTTLSLINGNFDAKKFRSEIRKNRISSAVALTSASNFMQKRKNYSRAENFSSAAIAILEERHSKNLTLDQATAAQTIIAHTNNLIFSKKTSDAEKFLLKIRNNPIINHDLRRQQLQLAFATKNADEIVALCDSLFKTYGVTDGAVVSIVGAIEDRTLNSSHIKEIDDLWGDKIVLGKHGIRYLNLLKSMELLGNRPRYRVQSDVVLTSSGYAFLIGGNHSIIKYTSGEWSPSEQSVLNFSDNIKKRKQICSQYNAKYCHIIFPDKQSVLSEEFPFKPVHRLGDFYIEKLDMDSSSDVLYPINKLSKNSSQAYHHLDTHLTDHGSLLVLESMLDKIGVHANGALGRISSRITKEVRWPGDLGGKFDPKLYQTGLLLEPDWKIINFQSPGGFNDGMIDIALSPEAPIDKTVLLFGDSFFRMMLKHLSGIFKKVICLRTRFFHEEMVCLIKPDIIFSGNSERYLSDVSSDSEANAFFLYPHIKESKNLEMNKDYLDAISAILSPQSTISADFFSKKGLTKNRPL